MNSHYSLVFDVGGIFIKAAVLNHRGELSFDSGSFYPSRADMSKETLLEHLVDIICQQAGKIMDKRFVLDGLAFAFPGPFEYSEGICRISGVNKFESLFGVNLRMELAGRLKRRKMFAVRMSADFSIVFENNAEMFALGEWLTGSIHDYRKTICLTVGYGTGSAFLEEGRLIKSREDVPANGWIYNVPFKEARIDDYMSARGILGLARTRTILHGLDVEEIAAAARDGNSEARDVFRQFGHLFGEMLQLFVPAFGPDALFIGGRVAHCYDLFKEPLLQAVESQGFPILTSTTTSNSTFTGIAKRLHSSISSEEASH